MSYSVYRVWTKPLWYIIHTMSDLFDKLLVGIENDNMSSYILQSIHYFYQYLVYIIPCRQCQVHYKQYIQNFPPNKPFSIYSLNIHNNVNRLLRKSSFTDLTKYHQLYSVNIKTVLLLKSYLKFYMTFCCSQNILSTNINKDMPQLPEWWFYYCIQLLYVHKYKTINESLQNAFFTSTGSTQNFVQVLSNCLQQNF